MAMTAAEFSLFLEPKLSNIWYDAYPRFESMIGDVLNVRDMNKNTITDAKFSGFGNLQDQPDGSEIIYDDPISPISKAYNSATRRRFLSENSMMRSSMLFPRSDAGFQ